MEILILIGIIYGLYRLLSSPKKRPAFEIRIEGGYYDEEDEGDDSVLPDDVWVPYGESIMVAGHQLDGGMLYVGEGLKCVSEWSIEHALINPKLKVNKRNPDRTGSRMYYWPSYSEISPEARAGYLEWLAGGRNDTGAYIGYVFLYFYGLERRVMCDIKNSQIPKDEIRKVLDEVKRLLDLYGNNSSFHGYASRFIDTASALHFSEEYKSGLESQDRTYGEMPFGIKYALSRLAFEGKPVDADMALSFIQNDPDYYLRTPAIRCKEEFDEFFRIKYKEAFKAGYNLKRNKTRLKVSYRAASASFGGEETFQFDNLSDVTVLKQPWQKIRALADVCTGELDAYSRYLGRNPSKHDGAEAFALLPEVLFKDRLSGKILDLTRWIEALSNGKDIFSTPFQELISGFPYLSQSSFKKREAVALSQFLEKLGYGIEPDVRFFGKAPKDGELVVLFKLCAEYESTPSDQYAHAALMIELATMVAAADGIISKEEEYHLESHLESQLHLSKNERNRLRAKLALHLIDSNTAKIAKRHLEALDEAQRESIGRFITDIARADEIIDPEEVKTLEKIYKSLGLDVQALYRSLHEPTSEPRTIISDERVHKDFSIPSAPKKPLPGVELDKEVVLAKLKESAAVSTLLNSIFVDEEESQVVPVEEQPTSIEGFDAEASSFVGKILERQTWKRSELEALAEFSGVMLDGTLDSINDACIELTGEPLIEGDEMFEVNEYVVKELAI